MDSSNDNPTAKRSVGRPRKSTSSSTTDSTDSTAKKIRITNTTDNINADVDCTSGATNTTDNINADVDCTVSTTVSSNNSNNNNAITPTTATTTTSLCMDLSADSNNNNNSINNPIVIIDDADDNQSNTATSDTADSDDGDALKLRINDKVKCTRFNCRVGTVLSTKGSYEVLFKGGFYRKFGCYHIAFTKPILFKISDIEFRNYNEPIYSDFDKDIAIDDPELLAGIKSFAERKALHPNEILENIQIKGKLVDIVLKENPEFKSIDSRIIEKNVLEIVSMEYLGKHQIDNDAQLNKIGVLVLDYVSRIMKESDYWKYLYFDQYWPHNHNTKFNLALLYLSIQKRADFGIKVDDRCDIENNLNELLFHLK